MELITWTLGIIGGVFIFIGMITLGFSFANKEMKKVLISGAFYTIIGILALCLTQMIKNNTFGSSSQKLHIVAVNSKDTITGDFEDCGKYYLNIKDSSKIYMDKIVYEKTIK